MLHVVLLSNFYERTIVRLWRVPWVVITVLIAKCAKIVFTVKTWALCAILDLFMLKRICFFHVLAPFRLAFAAYVLLSAHMMTYEQEQDINR